MLGAHLIFVYRTSEGKKKIVCWEGPSTHPVQLFHFKEIKAWRGEIMEVFLLVHCRSDNSRIMMTVNIIK